MLAFIKLYSINFWKTKSGPFFVFGFPAMMLLILGGIMPFSYIAGGMLLLPLITVGALVNPTALADFRSSKILKRIALTKITKAKLIQALVVFNIIVMTIATLVGLGYIAIFDMLDIGKTSFETADGIMIDSSVQWSSFTFANIMLIVGLITSLAFLMTAIGLAIGFKSNSPMGGQTNGMFIYFPVTFLSGVFLDINSMKGTFMETVSNFLPTRWIIEPIVLIFNGQGLDSLSNGWFLWAGPLAAIAIGAIILYHTIKSLKWSK